MRGCDDVAGRGDAVLEGHGWLPSATLVIASAAKQSSSSPAEAWIASLRSQ